MSQYDISVAPNYLERNMFLNGVVSLQRFDTVRYPRLDVFEDIQRGYFWNPKEVDMTRDRQDMKDASVAAKHMVTANLLRQTTLDSLQGRGPMQSFGPVASVPELEKLLSAWNFIETNIHSNAYSHIIRGIYSNPGEIFDSVHEVEPIVNMALSVGKYYDALDLLNASKRMGIQVNTYEHKKAIWLALHASYALEALRFMVSFATSLGMMENRLFVGIGNQISLILQDELLHTEWTAYIINQIVKDDPDFAKIKAEMFSEVYNIYLVVIAQEKHWAEYLFSKGVVIGLNVAILSSFVDWTAAEKLKDIGIKYLCDTVPKTHPIPWFLKHQNIDSKQSALQETESTSYVTGLLSDDLDYSQLPDL